LGGGGYGASGGGRGEMLMPLPYCSCRRLDAEALPTFRAQLPDFT